MPLIKRKQLDLAIKSATAAGVTGNVYGTSNFANIASGMYAIADGDQYEAVIDKIVGAVETVASSGSYAFTANGAGSVTINLGATVDFSGTNNQITVSKTNTGSTAIAYTFALPSAVTMPGSLSVTTTTTLGGNVTLSGNSQTITHSGTGGLTIASTNGNVVIENTTFAGNDVTVPGNTTMTGTLTVGGTATFNGAIDSNSTVAISGNITLDGTTTQSITQTGSGNLSISSTNASVVIEGSTFTGSDMTLPGNLTMSSTTATITHNAASGNLSISSTNGNVVVEGTTFSGNNATIPGNLTVSGNLSVVGNITQTSVNNIVVADALIKLADGNTGTINLTGTYQQTGSSSFAGLVYSASPDASFKFFTSTTEPTTSSTFSSLTSAKIEFNGLGTDALETIQDAVAAMLTTQSGAVTATYNDAAGTIALATNYTTILNNLSVSLKAYYDGNTDTISVNLGTDGIKFGESDTAFVKKDSGNRGMQVIVRGTVHEDIVYNATAAAGKFTIDAFQNAVIKLSSNITAGEFVDNVTNLKEYVQVYVNGVKCRWKEYAFTAGTDTITVYSGNGTVPPLQTGIGFDLESTDIITVLYYADQANDSIP